MKKLSFQVILYGIKFVFGCKLIKIKLYLVYFLIFNVIFFSKSQNIEIELEGFAENYQVLSLKEQGLVLFYTSQNAESNQKFWNFIKLDTTLAEVWKTNITASKDFEYINYCHQDTLLYLLYIKNYAYEIVTINLISGENSSIKGISEHKQMFVEDFKIVGNLAVWGGCLPPSDAKVLLKTGLSLLFFPLLFVPNFIPDKNAFAMSVDLQTARNKNYSFNFKGFSSVTDITSDSANFNGCMFVKNTNGKNTNLFVQDLTETGARARSLKLNPVSPKYSLINGKIGYDLDSKKVIIGTYTKGNNSGAQGFYFSAIKNGKQDFIQYHSFSKLSNFFNYLGEKGKEKMTEKLESKKKNGKDLSLNYNLLLHDILVGNGTFKVIAESYYAQYRTDFRTIWINGRPVQQMYDIFDGWRFSHAVVACFDTKGNLLWNDWLPIINSSSFSLYEKVLAFESNNFVHLVYNNNGNIVSKSINQNNPIQDVNYDNVNQETETFDASKNFKVTNWYNNKLVLVQYSGPKSWFNSPNEKSKILISKYNLLKIK